MKKFAGHLAQLYCGFSTLDTAMCSCFRCTSSASFSAYLKQCQEYQSDVLGGKKLPFATEVASEEEVSGGVVNIVFLLHGLAVARLHPLLLHQVGLAAPASDGKWWGFWLGDALISLTHLPSRSLETSCVLGSLGSLLHSFASPLPPLSFFPPLPLAFLGLPQFERVRQNLKICSSWAPVHLLIMVRRRGQQVDW